MRLSRAAAYSMVMGSLFGLEQYGPQDHGQCAEGRQGRCDVRLLVQRRAEFDYVESPVQSERYLYYSGNPWWCHEGGDYRLVLYLYARALVGGLVGLRVCPYQGVSRQQYDQTGAYEKSPPSSIEVLISMRQKPVMPQLYDTASQTPARRSIDSGTITEAEESYSLIIRDRRM